MANVSPTERALVDALDEPALVVRGSTIRLANPAALELLGADIEGRDIRLAIRHPQALERILTHRSAEIDVTGIAELGRAWHLIIRELESGSALVRMIDRSDSVSAEKMRVDFVANASHELRTPLSAVIGYAETLADDAKLGPEVRENFTKTIRDEARRMLRIIEDLIDLSRIEANRFLAPSENVSVTDIVETAVCNVRQARPSDTWEFSVAIPGDLPSVRGDRAQLVQVLDNLVSNAVRYGCHRPNSGVVISASHYGPWIVLTVADRGPGIAREHLPRVTERFYRADAARSREAGGTGLGLAIVKHIVERHRGVLEIKSEVGVGTSVSVCLPMAS